MLFLSYLAADTFFQFGTSLLLTPSKPMKPAVFPISYVPLYSVITVFQRMNKLI